MVPNETLPEESQQPPELPSEGTDPTAQLEPQAEIERLQSELSESQNRYLRSQADLENYRKRARRELDDERKYAFMPLLKDIVPVLDNLERAMEAAQKNADAEKLLEGIKMVSKQMEEVLGRHACTRIPAQGELFDPNLHQAIMQQPSPEYPENTVLHVAQAGFQLHDRVVRPAQVIVSKAP